MKTIDIKTSPNMREYPNIRGSLKKVILESGLKKFL